MALELDAQVIISALVLASLPFILHQILVRQRPGDPPLHKGWIPYYGVSRELDQNPEKLLARLHKKYGDIFDVWTNGARMTICFDILEAVPSMYRNTKQMDFHDFEVRLHSPVFGYPVEYRDNPDLQKEIHDLTNVYSIKAGNVKLMTEEFTVAFDKLLHQSIREKGTEFVTDMRDWARYLMYAATCKALFGQHFPAEEEQMFRDFLAWEWDFVNMAKHKPMKKIQKGWDARERIFKRISEDMAVHEDKVTDFIKTRIQIHKKYGYEPTSRGFASGMLQLIFAGTANTLPTSFWYLSIALSDPRYTKMLRERIALYVKSDELSSASFDYQGLTNDPILTSFFSEVLRLKASVWGFRLCIEDAILPVGGKEYFFKKGTTIWVPVPIVHRDEEIYEKPQEFEPNRFLKVEDGKMTKKVMFKKNGKLTRLHICHSAVESLWYSNLGIGLI